MRFFGGHCRYLKGQCNKTFYSRFFHQATYSGLKRYAKKRFRIFSNFQTYSCLEYLEIESPISLTAGSQKLSLGQPILSTLLDVPGEQCSTCIVDFLL
jgi:hypothetical protein